MPKHYKDMMDEIINKMDEDAPANAVAHGGVDMAPNAKHPLTKSHNKYKKDNENEVMKRLGLKIKESDDNNNVTMKSVLEQVDKLDTIIDKYNGVEQEEITIEPEKEYKTFKEKYNA